MAFRPKMGGNAFAPLHNQIAQAESNLSLTPQGSGGYDMHHDTLAPRRMGAKPQTPAQHQAVLKAASSSVAKRKIAAGLPLIGNKPKMGMI